MKQLFTFLFTIILTTSIFAQKKFTVQQLYLDGRLGFRITQSSIDVNYAGSIGYRINNNLGFGIQYAYANVEEYDLVTLSVEGLGIEARHHTKYSLAKVGMVIPHRITTTGNYCVTNYQREGTPMYLNGYLGFRLKIFTIGLNLNYSPNHNYLTTNVQSPNNTMHTCVSQENSMDLRTITLNIGFLLHPR